MTDINTEKNWEKFLKSGKVGDYLQYKNVTSFASEKSDAVGIDNDIARVNGMNNYANKNKGDYNQTS